MFPVDPEKGLVSPPTVSVCEGVDCWWPRLSGKHCCLHTVPEITHKMCLDYLPNHNIICSYILSLVDNIILTSKVHRRRNLLYFASIYNLKLVPPLGISNFLLILYL